MFSDSIYTYTCVYIYVYTLYCTYITIHSHLIYSLIPVCAEVQRPILTLDQCTLHIENGYTGIPNTQTVTLINRGLIPTAFKWISQHVNL